MTTTTTATSTLVTLSVTGLTCGACVRHVQQALVALDGVTTVEVDRATGTALVTVEAGVGTPVLVDAVRRAGYDADVRAIAAPPGQASHQVDAPVRPGGCCGCCGGAE